MTARWAGVGVALVALAASADALAAEPAGPAGDNPHLADARRLYFDLKYDESLEALTLAEAYPAATRADLTEVHELRVFALVVKKRTKEAEAAARRLLALDPTHAFPSKASPRFVEFLDSVRKKGGAAIALRLEHVPVERAPSFPVGLPATLHDTEGLADAIILHRRVVGEPAWAEDRVAATPGKSSFALAPPTGGGRDVTMEYFIEVRARSGARVLSVGSEGAPLRVVVGDGGKTPGATGGGGSGSVATRWWFWTVIGGAVVAGVALGLVFGLRGGVLPPPTTGDVLVTIERP